MRGWFLGSTSINLRRIDITESLAKLIQFSFSTIQGTREWLLKMTGFIIGKYALQIENKEESKTKEFSNLKFNDAFDKANSSPILDTISSLIRSSIMDDKEYGYIKGSLLNLLKWWIEKACIIQIQDSLKDCEKIYELLIEFLKETYWLDDFWKIDVPNNTAFYNLIRNNYLRQFPLEPDSLWYVLYYLIGNKDANYSDYLMEFLGCFNSFVINLNSSRDVERMKLLGDDEFDYVTKQEVTYGIFIPEGTKARKIHKGKDIYELDVKYDIWSLFFIKWQEILMVASERNLPNSKMNYYEIQLQYIVKFICKLLILSPDKIELMNPSFADISTIANNVSIVSEYLFRSLERLKILLIANKNDPNSSLESISMIINAIGSLYRKHSYRKHISDILDQFEENLEEYGRHYSSSYLSHGGGNNKFFQMLKELSSIESSIGIYSVTKAIHENSSKVGF